MELRKFDLSQTDEIVRFVAENPVAPAHPERRVRRFLTSLVSSPSLVFDLHRDGERVGVAVLVDRVQNVANCAILEILALRGEPTSILRAVIEKAKLQLGVEFAGIETAFYPDSAVLTLEEYAALGFKPYYQAFDMHTETPTAPPGLKLDHWSLLNMNDFADYYTTLRNAFSKNVESSIPSSESVLHTFETTAILPYVRKEEGRIAAFVSIANDLLTNAGEIMTVGVHEDFRGQGYGREALAKGLEILKQQGSKTFKLTVEAENENALSLYRSFGFRAIESSRCLIYLRT